MHLQKKYMYKVYGLNVISDFELSELIAIKNTHNTNIDVTISHKIVKEINYGGKVFSRASKFNKNYMNFIVRNVGDFHIKNGNEINIEFTTDSNMDKIKAFLFGFAFGDILMQRNTISIHGGTVVVDNKAIVISGKSGAGKSTLTSYFIKNGYKFVAEEVSVINEMKNLYPFVLPSYPYQRLCGDVMDTLGYNKEKAKKTSSSRDKYIVPAHDTFNYDSAPLGAIFEISIGNNSRVEFEEIRGIEKLKVLRRHLYRGSIVNYFGFEEEYFKKYLKIAQSIPMYKIIRPEGKFTVDEQMKFIIDTIKEKYEKVV